MDQKIRVEDFGKVRPHQSWALNTQLQEHLKEFDKQYAKLGGRIGSLSHKHDRMDFARIASKGMLGVFEDDPNIITRLSSKTEFSCASLQADIYIETDSRFSYGNQPPPLSILNR